MIFCSTKKITYVMIPYDMIFPISYLRPSYTKGNTHGAPLVPPEMVVHSIGTDKKPLQL